MIIYIGTKQSDKPCQIKTLVHLAFLLCRFSQKRLQHLRKVVFEIYINTQNQLSIQTVDSCILLLSRPRLRDVQHKKTRISNDLKAIERIAAFVRKLTGCSHVIT